MSASKPHVHAALIKAWADGAKIQVGWCDGGDDWEDTTNPVWSTDFKYRIKPEPVYTAYYKRAVFKGGWPYTKGAASYFISSVHERYFDRAPQDTRFVRWVDTEPQRELVSE